MNKLIVSTLIILLNTPFAFGWMGALGVGGGVPASASESYGLMYETFETNPGADLTWVESGTIDDDYVTIVLEGSESCHIDGSSATTHTLVSPTNDKIYIAAKLRISAATADNSVTKFVILNSSSVTIGSIILRYDSGSSVFDEMKTLWWDTSSQNETVDTTDFAKTDIVYVKVEYDNDAAAGTWAFFYAIDSSGFPGWTQIGTTKTGCASADQANKIRIRSENADIETVVDEVKVDTEDIVQW